MIYFAEQPIISYSFLLASFHLLPLPYPEKSRFTHFSLYRRHFPPPALIIHFLLLWCISKELFSDYKEYPMLYYVFLCSVIDSLRNIEIQQHDYSLVKLQTGQDKFTPTYLLQSWTHSGCLVNLPGEWMSLSFQGACQWCLSCLPINQVLYFFIFFLCSSLCFCLCLPFQNGQSLLNFFILH